MAEIVNLRLARKRKARADASDKAATNRALHGMTLAEKRKLAADRDRTGEVAGIRQREPNGHCPAATGAGQRFSLSGCASGPAQMAAVIAAKLLLIPPKNAVAALAIPVITNSGAGRSVKPLACITASPGRFCDAMVTI